MEPIEFEQRWDVSRQDLADICGCSKSQVDHWYSVGKDSRSPSEHEKRLLELANYFWTVMETEPQYLRKLREIYFRIEHKQEK